MTVCTLNLGNETSTPLFYSIAKLGAPAATVFSEVQDEVAIGGAAPLAAPAAAAAPATAPSAPFAPSSCVVTARQSSFERGKQWLRARARRNVDAPKERRREPSEQAPEPADRLGS